MAAIAFDPLEYTHELEASRVPREQAEVHARAMTASFVHNLDAPVTRDYLDTRFTEFETRVEAGMDKRFIHIETKMDRRFVEIETKMDGRFVTVEARIDKLSDAIELRFERMEGKFSRIHLMFGLTMATATIPILQNFFGA